VYFHFTKRGRDGDANALWNYYSMEFKTVVGAPTLVWIAPNDKDVQGVSGFTDCNFYMWNSLENGLADWWVK